MKKNIVWLLSSIGIGIIAVIIPIGVMGHIDRYGGAIASVVYQGINRVSGYGAIVAERIPEVYGAIAGMVVIMITLWGARQDDIGTVRDSAKEK